VALLEHRLENGVALGGCRQRVHFVHHQPGLCKAVDEGFPLPGVLSSELAVLKPFRKWGRWIFIF